MCDGQIIKHLLLSYGPPQDLVTEQRCPQMGLKKLLQRWDQSSFSSLCASS